MQSCRDIANQASDYLDGHLTLRQRLGFALHLLMCGQCRLFLRHLRLTLAVYRSMPPQEISPQEAESLVSKVLGDRRPGAAGTAALKTTSNPDQTSLSNEPETTG